MHPVNACPIPHTCAGDCTGHCQALQPPHRHGAVQGVRAVDYAPALPAPVPGWGLHKALPRRRCPCTATQPCGDAWDAGRACTSTACPYTSYGTKLGTALPEACTPPRRRAGMLGTWVVHCLPKRRVGGRRHACYHPSLSCIKKHSTRLCFWATTRPWTQDTCLNTPRYQVAQSQTWQRSFSTDYVLVSY